MFDWLLPEDHAIAMIKKDHDTVKDLFDEFEKADRAETRRKIIADAITELKLHAILEEEIFYPAVRGHVDDKLMNEADEEHHVAKVLIAELDTESGRSDHYEAKFTVLAENVRHHIREEENEVLPKASDLKIDFEELGRRMRNRKRQLLHNGIPTDAEHTMVSAAGNADSPARAAATHRQPTVEAATHLKEKAEAATHRQSTAEAATHRKPTAEAATHRKPTAEAATHRKPKAEAATHRQPKTKATATKRKTTATSRKTSSTRTAKTKSRGR